MKKTTVVTFALLLGASLASAQSGTTAPNNNVSVSVAAEAALTIAGSGTTLTSIGTNFADYTGSTAFTYFIRTGEASGTGSINLKVTTDFSPNGGPSVTTPPTAGDALTYVNTISAPGSAVAGSQTASTGTDTGVATFAAAAHSAKAGNSGSLAWTLSNDPLYKTGSYTAVVTFTISAT